MRFKRLRRRFKRQLAHQQEQVEAFGQSAEKGIERNLFRRFARLRPVKRFVAAWTTLLILVIGCLLFQIQSLSAYYQTVQPVPGGIYNEGIIGTVSNVNPIFATSNADSSLARLLFAGLLTYDTNGKLVGDLASGYQVTNSDRTYRVSLKPNLRWHDGRPLTASDVVFTYKAIENPDAQSPLFNSWQGVDVVAVDSRTIDFTLPSPLASFPYNLTTGIIPKHILGTVPAANLRSSDFNTANPIGAGPFTWHGLQVSGNDPANAQEQIALLPFKDYIGGKPALNEFIMHCYASESGLTRDYRDGRLTAAAGLNTVPADISKQTQTHSLLLRAGTYVFFKTSTGVLADQKVRQALVAASQPSAIIKQLGYTTIPVTEPLLARQPSFTPQYAQKTSDITTAKSILAADGWTTGSNGILTKAGQPLSFGLTAIDIPEYRQVTDQLKRQWQQLGVQLKVQLQSPADYTTTLSNHDYDATLYGIATGLDPDVYVYWDSSQADVRSTNRLNLSEWRNPTADAALEAGRTRLDPGLRKVKYAPFLQAWQQDAPALGLYQPRYLYITRGPVYGLTNNSISDSTDRYAGVQNWKIRSAKVTQ